MWRADPRHRGEVAQSGFDAWVSKPADIPPKSYKSRLRLAEGVIYYHTMDLKARKLTGHMLHRSYGLCIFGVVAGLVLLKLSNNTIMHRSYSSQSFIASASLNRVKYLERATATLRMHLFKAICKSEADVSESGAWCLYPSERAVDYYPYALPHEHAVADEGVARTVMSIVRPGQRLLDLGCGVGQYGLYFKKENAPFQWTGYDGAINVEEYTNGFVHWADLSVPGFAVDNLADWVMALEVGEHVPAEFEDAVIDNIARNSKCGAIVSWAIPGQGGHAHVNNRPSSYVIDKFKSRGFEYDEVKSREGQDAAQYIWFKDTLMVFRKTSSIC